VLEPSEQFGTNPTQQAASVRAVVTTSSEPLLTCENLLVGYAQPILPPVTLAIRPGDLWAIVGANGAGKSTWMRTVLKLQPSLGGQLVWGRNIRAAYVPQSAALDLIYPVRVRDMVEMGLLRPKRFLGFSTRSDRSAIRAALAQVNAEALIDHPFRDLSGGQRQRVLIARALASGAQLFFFDEPTSALDRHSERAVLDIIDTIRRMPGAAVALITHHLQVLRGRADHAILLDREHNIAVAGTAEEVTSSATFVHLFGEAAAVHDLGQT
jgi:ABC-type Mn2+/Zn2+ transport system ATPase subunit